MKVYVYKKCDSCRKALKWLESCEIDYEEVPIRETPPSLGELRFALEHVDGGLRKLFNTSGMDYRALDLKTKLPAMGESEALELLASNGNLIKRPFLIDENAGVALVGFKQDAWKVALN